MKGIAAVVAELDAATIVEWCLLSCRGKVRVRARQQLLLGASQIKLTAGGGVASPNSALDGLLDGLLGSDQLGVQARPSTGFVR
jgi:hypothetical protein